jgi:vacuolar iron transporter family protein
MPSNNFPYLKEFVYGGIDGCVTTFAVVAGATGANLHSGIIIVLGFANLIADGFSMSVGNFLSVKSDLAQKSGLGETIPAKTPLQTAGATFASFLVMGIIPLLAYVFSYFNVLDSAYLFFISSSLTVLAFLIIGFLRSHVTKTSILRGITETLLLGGIAALLAFFIGDFLERML